MVLRYKEFYARWIDIPEHWFKIFQTVIFTAQTHDQNCSRIRIVDQTFQQFLSHQHIISKLAAARIMNQCLNSIYAPRILFRSSLRQDLCCLINTANRRNNPNLVSRSCSSIFPEIAIKICFFLWYKVLPQIWFRMILIFQKTFQICCHIVDMYMFSHMNRTYGVSNRQTILDHIFIFSNLCQGNFMCCRNVIF